MILTKEERRFQKLLLQDKYIKQLNFYIGQLESEVSEKDYRIKGLFQQLSQSINVKDKLKKVVSESKKNTKRHPCYLDLLKRFEKINKEHKDLKNNYSTLMVKYLNKGK